MRNWIFQNHFSLPNDETLKEIIHQIEISDNSNLSIDKEKYLSKILNITFDFANNPWITQAEIAKKFNLKKEELLFLNTYIRNNLYLQNLISKEGAAYKYWQTISPFCSKLENGIKNVFSYPMRIALYPGVSCMYYCGFCGRNQDAKYSLNAVDDSYVIFKNILSELDPENTAISISGGLEPLTNSKIGEIVEAGSNLGFKVPLITNAHSLTENNLKRQKGLMKLDSLRVSLYGVDEKSYEFLTTIKKSYAIVKRNCINFLKYRNEINPKLKFGFNYIIIRENIKDLPKLIEFINEINSSVTNGPGIDFLSLRDDFGSVTGIYDTRDSKRKYHLSGLLTFEERENLRNIFATLENQVNKHKIHIDYGYALYSIKNGISDNTLKKVTSNEMRKYAHTQMSVCIDMLGDVYLYREAGFLNREGNKKFIIGRTGKKNTLKNVLEKFLYDSEGIQNEQNDIRFMDPFDHVLTSLVNQAETDNKFGIPFEKGPVKLRSNPKKINVGNSWYKDV